MIYDYEVKEVQTFDRNKPYWSKHYNLVLANLPHEIVEYNIATQYNKDINTSELFLIVYEHKVIKALPVRKHSNGKYKFYFGHYLSVKNEDYNVKLEYVESRDNPACHIYKVSVN